MADTPITSGTTLLPAEMSSTPTSAVEAVVKDNSRKLPPVTTGTTEYYIKGLASAVSRASATDPFTILLQGEKLPPGQSITDLDLASIQRMVHDSALTRIATKLKASGFIVEAGGFATVACWEPGMVGEPYASHSSVLAQRPLFAEFVKGWANLMRRHLYPIAERVSGGRYWKLSLMARDPAVEYVPGAVRAVLVPFIERFTSDQNEDGPMPVWLEAGSDRARAIYAHYGFREVGEVEANGIKTWGMIGSFRVSPVHKQYIIIE
ncbi:hypothetical protein F5Y06DRAFT_206432 [Hypoxylon sp. FL0890]|nr:hypothetical protein F5Y06DRAFT_206432 [Hypoxylon sp. FL0890]